MTDETPHQTGMISVLDTQDQVLALVPVLVLALSAEEEEGVEVEVLETKNIFIFQIYKNDKNLTFHLMNINTRF